MKTRNNAGFSLVEILVVLVIMGLLISVVAPTVLNRADEARVGKVLADFKNIETALKIYRLDNYVYPTTEQGLQALVEPSTLDPEPRNFKEDALHDKVVHMGHGEDRHKAEVKPKAEEPPAKPVKVETEPVKQTTPG